MKQAHIFISGYVHSVGFRRFVQKEAKRRGLTGWVRNLADRRVEAVLVSQHEDGEERILEVIKKCHKGPMMAEVKSVNYFWEETNDVFDEFEILETATI